MRTKDEYEIIMNNYKKCANRLLRASKSTSKEMDILERKKLKTLEEIGEFCDIVSKIQNRPQFECIDIKQTKLPEIDSKIFEIESDAAKKLMKKYISPEIGVNGLLVTPELEKIGVIKKHTSVAATSLDQMIQHFYLSDLYEKFSQKEHNQIYKLSLEIEKIEKNANEAVPKLNRILNAANKFRKSIERVEKRYCCEISVVKEAVLKTNKYEEFSDKEKIALKNSVMLIGLLYQMCKIKLIKTSDLEIESIEISDEVDDCIAVSEHTDESVINNYLEQGIQVDYENSCEVILNPNITKKNITEACADSICVNQNYIMLDTCVVFFDEVNMCIVKVDYDNGEMSRIKIDKNFNRSKTAHFCGIGESIYFLLNEDGKCGLFEYKLSKNELNTIKLFDESFDYLFMQSDGENIAFVVDRWRSFGYGNDEKDSAAGIYIYNTLKKSFINILSVECDGFFLHGERLYISSERTLYVYPINRVTKEKICNLDSGAMDFIRDRDSERNVVIEDNKLITWSKFVDHFQECMYVWLIDLETKKKKKITIKDSCGLMGRYYEGYIYYIRQASEDSLCRYDLMTRKKKVIIEQTDCSYPPMHYINRENIRLQKINQFLYFCNSSVTLDDGTIMRIDTDNGFLLNEIGEVKSDAKDEYRKSLEELRSGKLYNKKKQS